MQRPAQHSIDAEPFRGNERYCQYQQDEAPAIVAVLRVVFADAADGAHDFAKPSRHGEQRLMPERLGFELAGGAFGIARGPLRLGARGFGCVV